MSEAGAGSGRVPVRVSTEVAERATRLAWTVLREPFRRRTWAELGFFLAGSALSAAAALALGALIAGGLLLSLVLVGVAVLAVALRAARGLGRWQRGLAWRLLGEEIPEPPSFGPRPGRLGWLRAALGDRVAWRALAYLVGRVPLTIFGVWFALSVWLAALSGIISPLTGGASMVSFGILRHPVRPGYDGTPYVGAPVHVGLFLGGVLLLFLAPWFTRLVVLLDRRMMHLLLAPDATASRVRRLEESRSLTLDTATATLQRIERNLHDGTQAQLVALAMRLGQAKEKLDGLDAEPGSAAGLEAVRHLVDEAHRGTKEAIADLRDLARGIHPPALDTGLAAELLANVHQHAQASRASLSCAEHGPWLRLVVRDDGRGGAAVNRGAGSSSSGLAGLADRVRAVEGNLSIASPTGGPTVVTVDLPTRA